MRLAAEGAAAVAEESAAAEAETAVLLVVVRLALRLWAVAAELPSQHSTDITEGELEDPQVHLVKVDSVVQGVEVAPAPGVAVEVKPEENRLSSFLQDDCESEQDQSRS